MPKKVECAREAQDSLDIGIYFEPLEQRLLLSASWEGGVDTPSPDLQKDTQSTIATEADAFF